MTNTANVTVAAAALATEVHAEVVAEATGLAQRALDLAADDSSPADDVCLTDDSDVATAYRMGVDAGHSATLIVLLRRGMLAADVPEPAPPGAPGAVDDLRCQCRNTRGQRCMFTVGHRGPHNGDPAAAPAQPLDFERLPAAVANAAVRAVEDAWYANGANDIGQLLPNGTEGPEAIRALLDLGWTPPAGTS